MTNVIEKYKTDFFLLVEAGFVAVNQFDEDAAFKLFKAAEILDPHNTMPQLGIGYIHLCKLELKQAIKVFDEILHKDPHNEMAKTLLGLSQSLNPTELAKGEKALEDAASHSKDSFVKSLAVNALDFVRKFVKKPLSPMHAQKKEIK
ncbi:MAG: putative SctF chaperone SctG [Chlamydiota bacterium]|jgi:tetratricopeptide (TPR) repeat protein